MKYEGNIAIFFEMVMDVTRDIILPIIKDDRGNFGKSLQKTILGFEEQPKIESNPSPYNYFVANKLFRPFSEIASSIESIENIPIYVRTFPYTRQGVSKINNF